MAEPFRYTVTADDEVDVVIVLGDGTIELTPLLPGSELLLDGPPGKMTGQRSVEHS